MGTLKQSRIDLYLVVLNIFHLLKDWHIGWGNVRREGKEAHGVLIHPFWY